VKLHEEEEKKVSRLKKRITFFELEHKMYTFEKNLDRDGTSFSIIAQRYGRVWHETQLAIYTYNKIK